jgi:uncharacterized protein
MGVLSAPNVLPDLDWRAQLVLGVVVAIAGFLLFSAPRRSPIRFALGIFIIEVGTMVAIRGLVASNTATWWQYLMPFALVLVPGLFVAVMLTRLGWWRRAGFTPVWDWRHLYLIVPLALTLALPAAGLSARGVKPTTAIVLALQIAFMLIDVFMEEVTYRGVILEALARYCTLWRVLISAAVFGLSHVDNFFVPGAETLGVWYQIFEAGLIGVLFAGVRLRMHAIWPVIAVHAAYDFMLLLAFGHAFSVAPTVPGFVVDTMVNLGLAGVGLFLVRSQPDRENVRRRLEAA